MKKIFLIFLLFYSPSAFSKTLTGLDILEKENFSVLKGKKVGLISNHSALNSKGEHILKVFNRADNFELKAIFSPEHGFSGQVEGGVHIANSSSSAGVPIYSLYGKNKRPQAELLKDLDILVFDIQDIGARFYTYLTTMGYAMEEAAKNNISFLVLDRPNPIGLEIYEGPILSENISAFTAYYPVPVRHALTAGETALFHKKNKNLKLDLKIIKAENYSRKDFFNDTALTWTNPSPNIRDLDAAILYPGLGCFEASNVSVGRGTDSPFHWFGAPWMKAKKIAKKLNAANIKGVKFKVQKRTPKNDLYEKEECEGIEIELIEPKAVRSLDIFVHAAYWLKKINGKKFLLKKEDIARMTGTYDFYEMIENGKKPEEIISFFENSNSDFLKKLKKDGILLYE
ncbi:MAG: DUF1343 domain-containing protein [Elusimicrobia bacterium]|nr:DUF1343 domain-containing protein [Elusimicrobiota bacterium]